MASDLTPEYIATLQRMTGEEKLRAAGQLYRTARKIKAARLRRLHPEWSVQQVEARVSEIFLYAGD